MVVSCVCSPKQEVAKHYLSRFYKSERERDRLAFHHFSDSFQPDSEVKHFTSPEPQLLRSLWTSAHYPRFEGSCQLLLTSDSLSHLSHFYRERRAAVRTKGNLTFPPAVVMNRCDRDYSSLLTLWNAVVTR